MIDIDALDEFNDFSTEKKSEYKKIGFIGGTKQEWPVKLRFVVNALVKEEAKPYHELITHTYRTSDNKFLNINCPRALKEKCPICDKYFELLRQSKDSATSPDRKIQITNELMPNTRPTRIFSTLVVVANSDEIKRFDVKPSLAEPLFGGKGILGILGEMKESGIHPFKPSSTQCWVEISKTGQKLETKYHAKAWMERSGASLTYKSLALSQSVLDQLSDENNLYRIVDSFRKAIWTTEELQAYADNFILPERYRKYYGQENIAEETKEAFSKAVETASKASLDDLSDIPF